MFHEKVSTRVKVWPEYEKAVAMARRFKRLHPDVQVVLSVHEFRRLGRGTDLLVTVEDLRKAGIALEFLSGPVTGLYDPGDRHGQGAILFGVLAALTASMSGGGDGKAPQPQTQDDVTTDYESD